MHVCVFLVNQHWVGDPTRCFDILDDFLELTEELDKHALLKIFQRSLRNSMSVLSYVKVRSEAMEVVLFGSVG
jgi:hypothetical protein